MTHVASHHHHFMGRDKYDGDLEEVTAWHDGHDPKEHHLFHERGEKWPTTGACQLGTECESYMPVLEDEAKHNIDSPDECPCHPLPGILGPTHRPMADA